MNRVCPYCHLGWAAGDQGQRIACPVCDGTGLVPTAGFMPDPLPELVRTLTMAAVTPPVALLLYADGSVRWE